VLLVTNEMLNFHILLLHFFALSPTASTMEGVVKPIMTVLIIIAGLCCVLFLSIGGINYMSSSGQPEKLAHAKKVIRNSILGLIIVLAAATLTAILTQEYGSSSGTISQSVPSLNAIKPASSSFSLVELITKAIIGVLQNIVSSVAAPFINALQFFTTSTPLMAANPSVFNLWLAVLAIADALFVLVVAALGFHLMSAASLGIGEIELKHLLPQITFAFLMMNSSIFVIDTIIGLSNGMIDALRAGFGGISVWQTLIGLTQQAGGFGLAALLIMVVFVIMSVILLVYYVGRLVTLYLGAVLAPLVLLLWLLPGFKDFAANAAKTYLTTIFVLFVHVIILELAASIFETIITNGPSKTADPLMALVVGLSTLVALLKTQGVMTQLSYASIGPRAIRRLSAQFVDGVSHVSGSAREGA
jgi:hypothetical protein